jgi:hypothetical protein
MARVRACAERAGAEEMLVVPSAAAIAAASVAGALQLSWACWPCLVLGGLAL